MNESLYYEKLLEKAGRKVSLTYREYQEVFIKLYPEFQITKNREILQLLTALEAKGEISFQKKMERFLVDGKPFDLPVKINILANKKTNKELPTKKSWWIPQLHFADKLPDTPHRKDLEIINEYIIKNRPFELTIPVKERSLRIFGHEKKLDSLLDGDALFREQVDLKLLGCQKIPLPLEHQTFEQTKSSDLLILENFSSYWSFCEWNRKERWYSVIAYGAGLAIYQSHEQLERLIAKMDVERLYYLGDLDPTGIRIPWVVSGIRKEKGLKPVEPLTPVYRYLIESGTRTPLLDKEEPGTKELEAIQNWFEDAALTKKVVELFQNKQRVPQESFGLEELTKKDLFSPK